MYFARLAAVVLITPLMFVEVLSRSSQPVQAEEKSPLPETAVPVSKPDQWWKDRHQMISNRAKQGDVDVLFCGDSITQGWEGVGATWDKYFKEFKPMNAGIGGDKTQHVLWRLKNGNLENVHPKLMVLMIGTNNVGSNNAEDIATGVREIVKQYRELRPDSKVLLLAIFPRGEKPDENLRKIVTEASQLASQVADGKNVVYLDINKNFLLPDGSISKELMPDLVHLSEGGYVLWAEAVAPEIKKLIGGK